MVLADSLAVASGPVALTAALSIASFVTLVTLVALCACCKCCHRPLKEEDFEAYGVSTPDGHAPVVQFRDGKSKQVKDRPASEKMPKSALKKSSRSESAPADPSTTLLHSASTRRALPSLPSELKSPSSLTRESSASDLYATVDKLGNSVVAVVHDWKSETDTNTTRTTVSRTGVHRLKHGEQQQLVDEPPSYARIPPRNLTYDTIDAESDLTDPLYSKVDTVESRPYPFAAKAQTQAGKRGEHLYQRVDDDGSQIYAGGSEDPYSSIPSDVGGAKRLRTIDDDDDDDDESSTYDPGYARVTGKPKESSVDEAPGPSSRPVSTRNVDHLYTKIHRHSAPVSDDFSSDRRPPSPPPLPDNLDRRPRSEQPYEEAIREPSYRYITVRQSLDVLRARMAHEQREQNERMQQQQQTGPVREHYYATIGSEHGYEVVPNRLPQPLYEDVLSNGTGDGDLHRYDVVYPSGSSENTLKSSARLGDQDSATSSPRQLSIPPPIPPTSPIPERTPPKTEPPSRMYSRSTTGDFTTASEESRGADSFYSIDRDDLPPKRPNDPLVRGMAAVGQGAGELIDRGLTLIARSVGTVPTVTNGTPTANAIFAAEMTAEGGEDFDSSLELSGSPLPVDRTEPSEVGTGQGMLVAQQRYPPPTSYQKPISSLTTASAPLAPNGHNSSHPRSSQVTSSASRGGFSDDVDRWAAKAQEQSQAFNLRTLNSDNADIRNARRPAPEAVFPENVPSGGWMKRPLAREDSDQSFVTAPTSANDIVNGRKANGGHFELNNTATPTHSTYRELLAKQSSEESSDQEADRAFTARRRDWSELTGGQPTESTDLTKSNRRLREALRTRTESQESSSGVSGSLDTETKLDDNRTLSREFIDDGTLQADGGRSSRNGRRSAASASSENMHDSGMFAASFNRGDSQNDETPRVRQHADQTGVKQGSLSAHSIFADAGSPDGHGSKIPVLASKFKRQNSPSDIGDLIHRASHSMHVGFRPVNDDDEDEFHSPKSILSETGIRSDADYKLPSTKTAAEHHQSSIKPPSSLRNLENSNTPLNGNKGNMQKNSGGVSSSSSRLNFRPVFDESPISPDSVLSSQDTDTEAFSDAASSTFAASAANASFNQRSGTDAVDAHAQESVIRGHDRSMLGEANKDNYSGATAKRQGDTLLAAGTGRPVSFTDLRSEPTDEQRGVVADRKRWLPTGEPLDADVTESPTARRKVETRDYISPVDLDTKRAWPLQKTDMADERRDVSPDRATFASGLAEPDAGLYYQQLTSTPLEKRAEATESESCDGTCYCHCSMPVPERVWDENLYEMDKVRWGANRKSSSEESTKSDTRLL